MKKSRASRLVAIDNEAAVVRIGTWGNIAPLVHKVGMSSDANQILSLELGDNILRKFLRGKMIDVADATNVECAVRISCALPMEVITIHTPSEPDRVLQSLVGEENALRISRAFGGNKITYVQVPGRQFSGLNWRRLNGLAALRSGNSIQAVAEACGTSPETVNRWATIYGVQPVRIAA